MKAFAWLLPYILKYKWRFIFALTLVALETVLILINPNIVGKIVDDVINGGKIYLLPYYVGTIGAITIAYSAIRYTFRYNLEIASQNLVIDIRSKLYSKLQSLDFAFFDKNKTGEILSKLTGDMDAIRYFTAYVVYAVFQFALQICIVIPMFMFISVPFTLCILVLMPFIALIASKLSKSVRPAFLAVREQFSRLNSVVQENISGNRVVKAFAREDYEVEKFEKENQGYMNENLKASRIWQKYLPFLDAMANSTTVVIILLGGIFVINGAISLGQLVVFIGLSWAINNPMKMSGFLINDIQRTATACDKIYFLLTTKPRIENIDALLNDSENTDDVSVSGKILKGKIEFKDVTFKQGQNVILSDINFTCLPGQTIGIIGPTGSGKSSLINLIPRYYDCFTGEVLVDDVNVKDLGLNTLRDNIAVTMQDIFLFSDTIAANISYGIPDATEEEVAAAAHTACADEFIDKMADGYDAVIGEYGVGLSGGQRQRLSLARAILKNTPILILDDTTSALDMETEHKIQAGLKNLTGNKTVFIIAHRIASIKNADLILVIENGKITEMGKHKDLLANGGYYYDTFAIQHADDLHKIEAIEKEVTESGR